MNNSISDFIILTIILGSFGIIYLLSNFLRISLSENDSQLSLSQIVDEHTKEYGWILKLFVNCLGYSCVFVPGVIIYKYINRTNYIEKSSRNLLYELIKICFTGSTLETGKFTDREETSQANLNRTTTRDAVLLCYCFFGLMASYLTWGVLQEKIMTQEYVNVEGKKAHFKDSQFLVFANRLLAFFVAGIYILTNRHQYRHKVPLYKYSYASFSNIMSAWFQYEALKFVNFPTQVLAKSCKIIPVMLMGKIISRNKYEYYEYFTAILISAGMIFFLTGSADETKHSSITTITGVFLLALYMIFDSFTTNWQGDLFKTYSISSMQMMCGVNLFSSIFTATSLLLQDGFFSSIQFASTHPKFILDSFVLSISSAVGQLFIFYTISVFGPVVFTILMTVRQAAAIMLSCLIYKHNISSLGMIGVSTVFFAIFLRVYCNHRLKMLRKKVEASRSKLLV